MKTFRGYLIEQKELTQFYKVELVKIDNDILKAEASIKGNIEQYGIKPLFESLIEPHKIKIKTNDIEKLNKEFEKYKIVFEYSPNEIRAKYDNVNDTIYIIFKKDTDFLVLEALIGHESVHREQHKRAGENYFKQSEKIVKEINNLAVELNQIDMNNPNNVKIFQKQYKRYQELTDKFLYLTPYESMAYAYQFVKEYYYLTPSAIIDKLRADNIKINNITKKYVGMYWLIKDKIKGE